MRKIFFLLFVSFVVQGCSLFQQTTKSEPPASPRYPESSKIKPYKEIVTKEVKSDTGVFIVHRIKEKLLYEIPRKEFDKEFLLVSRQSKTQAGLGYGGDEVNEQVVKWERIGDRILIRCEMYNAVAADSLPTAIGVRKANNPPIIMSFDIQAFNKDSSNVVIDVTELFTTDIAELGYNRFQRQTLQIRRVDPRRSFIESVKAFPTNIETEATVTFDAGQVPIDVNLATISLTMHHSMVLLPEKPMKPRLFDSRVQYFGIQYYDYGFESQRAELRHFITRWRLEPKDTSAIRRGELSEPIKPIIFYIDRTVPIKWRQYLKQAVEDWQPAFEKAGFKNAIIAKDAPTVAEDLNWSAEDARYSVLRWLPSDIENAYGPHISDPRTGEIMEAHIGFFHNVMNLARNWYFVQAGAVDPLAQKLPLPDSLMGNMLRYICSHEVGHSLGFPHNMKATSQYPVDSLRSESFTAKCGTEASIMDYGRFNYIAQPGDKAHLIPKIGPYDMFATEWGYKPVLDAQTPEDEKPFLEKIIARQEKEPFLRFGNFDNIDPTAQTEDLGDDAVKATTYGLKNIKRIADILISATTHEGEDYSTLGELYSELLNQRNRELGHIASLVGGVERTERHAGTQGPVFTPIPKSRQQQAMKFLIDEAFKTPVDLIKPDILALIEPSGAADRVVASQRAILNQLFSPDRLNRMMNLTALDKTQTYTIDELLSDIRSAIWSELKAGKVTTDVYRRNLQRAFIEIMGARINPAPFTPPAGLPPGVVIQPPAPLSGEGRALIRYEIQQISDAIDKALPRLQDRETKAHLEDMKYQISRILFPEKK